MSAKEAWDRGLADLAASFRQGAKEIAQVLPAFNDGIRPVEEPGTMNNPVNRREKAAQSSTAFRPGREVMLGCVGVALVAAFVLGL